MVINVALGVFYYLDKEKVQKAQAEAAAAKKATDTANEQFTLLRDFFIPKMRSLIEPKQVKPEEYEEMRVKSEKALPVADSLFPWYRDLMLRVAGDPGKQDKEGKEGILGGMANGKPGFEAGEPKNGFLAVMKGLQEKINTVTQELKASRADYDTLKAEYDQYKRDWNDQKLARSLQDQSARSNDDLKKRIEEKDLVIEGYKKQYADLERQAAQELRKEKDRYEADLVAKERAYKDRVRELELSVKEELRKLQASQTVTLNEPRGEIVRIDTKGDLVYINLGTDARVPAKLPFMVYGRGPGGAARPVPKAKIEVIQNVDRNVSIARVLEIRKVDAPYDPNTSEDFQADRANWITDPRDFWQARNPLQRGDLLFNPAWDPRREVRVYLAGPFDLDGDGRDDVREVERLLQSYGVKVDGYLDPNTNYAPTGLLQYRTDFVVIGDVPEVLADVKQGGEPKRAQGNEMLSQIGKITQEAKEKGVEVISWKRFFARVGYSPSKLPAGSATSGSGVGGRGYVGVTK
jgi:hypothetical protein